MVKLFSKNSNLCDHNPPTSRTDGQTDRQTTCDRNTALCTKVHRAVKKNRNSLQMLMTLSVWSLKDCHPAKVHHVHCALCTAVRPMAHDPSSQSKLLVPESRTSNLEAIAHVPFCPSFWYQTNLVDYTSRIRDRLAKLLVRELVGLPLDLLLRHGIRPKFSAQVTDTRISYYSNFANVTCILAQDLSGTRNLDRIEHAIFQDGTK